MVRGVVGVIVTGTGGAAFDALGAGADAALAPFAGKYRFLDLAAATLANSGVHAVYVAAGGASDAVRAHVARARHNGHGRRPAVLRPLARSGVRSRGGRLLEALHGSRRVIHGHAPEAVVVLTGDHVMQLDLRPLVEAHRDRGADVTLVTLPATLVDAAGRPLVRTGEDGQVLEIRAAGSTPPDGRGWAVWTGDLVVRAGRLSIMLAAAGAPASGDDVDLLASVLARCRVDAFDGLERHGGGPARGPYWHDPATLEAYYHAQMNLCTPRPAFELHDAGWPLPSIASGLGPAKLVADDGGRASQALNTLVADGCVVRGASVLNAILGHGVVVDSCAEVEDSVLLDGCRIGAGARIRRAVVGAGAVVACGTEIGYGAPPAGASLAPSGLTVVSAPLS